MATQRISKREFCKMPCAQTDFLLRDARGACRPLRSDRYCRNHLILEHELATLPRLPELLALRPTALRLDLRLATPEQTATWIELYRAFLPRAAAAEPGFAEAARAALAAASPGQTFTFGAYGTGICRDEEISRLQIKKEQRHDATGG
jgi:collagenase-like PrtC family protease